MNETSRLFVPVAGMRIWDPWTRQGVGPGPRVLVSHPGRPSRRYELVRSGSGTHALHDAPLLAEGTAGALVELSDPSRQILPFRASLDLDGGLLASPLPSTPDAPTGCFPAFPDPARPAPTGWVCLRAQLRRKDSVPAQACPWALAVVRMGGQILARGVSGPDGALAVAFPPPPPRERPMGLPPEAPFEPRTWTVALEIRWAPARLTESVPNLSSLAAQPAVAAATVLPGGLAALECRAGDNILVSGLRPAEGAAAPADSSSFLFLQA